jgi:hypothetical protein
VHKSCGCGLLGDGRWTIKSGRGLPELQDASRIVGMRPEKMFHQMLDLGNKWEVASCEFVQENHLVTLHIRETPGF